jgi:hypothetical protein
MCGKSSRYAKNWRNIRLSRSQLLQCKKYFTDHKAKCIMYKLNTLLNNCDIAEDEMGEIENAYLLIVRNGVDIILNEIDKTKKDTTIKD